MKLPFPLAVLEQHTIVLGKTRSGKSSTMRLMVERLLDDKKPVCVIDPKGDWWGLKSSADGKQAGYPVVIFGGDHADVPINAHSGKHVAELVATGNRPCIIDLGGWTVSARTQFFIDFAETLFKHTRGARWLVIDECHNFAPQGRTQDPQAGMMVHWANRLASEGAGKGITLVSASQRPQKVHKDYVTSHETLIAKRVIHPLDRGAMKDWIDGCADPEMGKEVLTTLASMKREEGWVWSPEIDFGPKVINFPMFDSYDSFKAGAGQSQKQLKGWASVDLEEVTEKLKTVMAEAKANDPKELRAEVARLNKELRAVLSKPAENIQKPFKPDKDAIAAAEKRGFEQAQKKFARAANKAAIDEILNVFLLLQEQTKGLAATLDSKITQARKTKLDLAKEIEFNPPAPASPAPRNAPARPTVVAPRQPIARSSSAGSADGNLGKGERTILKAVAQYPEGAERDQLTVLTGYKRSSRDTYLQRLGANGFIEITGGSIRATEAGIEALGADFEPLPTGQELQDYWLSRLSGGEQAILRCLIEAYPDAMERTALDERTNYKRSSRDTYLQRLMSRRLVTAERGTVRASDILFEQRMAA